VLAVKKEKLKKNKSSATLRLCGERIKNEKIK